MTTLLQEPILANAAQCLRRMAISGEEYSSAYGSMLSKMAPIKNYTKRVAVAFSGGPDSTALLRLTAQLLGPQAVVALSVDHGLPDDVQEDRLQRLLPAGVELVHHKLSWPLVEQTPKWLLAARERRYSVLGETCSKLGINLLLTGHHRDDDLVTMCYRIGRHSGVDGMAGMRPLSTLPLVSPYSGRLLPDGNSVQGVFVGRPLLQFEKSRLRATVQDGPFASYIVDPDNQNPLFLRNSISNLLQSYGERDNLMHMLDSLKMLNTQTISQLVPLMRSSVILDRRAASSIMVLNDERLLTVHAFKPLLLRAVNTLIQYGSAGTKPVRAPMLNALYERLQSAYQEFLKEEQQRQRRLPAQYRDMEPLPVDKTRKLETSSMALGGGVVHPLSRVDAMRRITYFNNNASIQKAGLEVKYGPAFLIQGERPRKGNAVELSDFENYILFDQRLFIKPNVKNVAVMQSYQWTVSPLTIENVKLFEELTMGKRTLRAPLRLLSSYTPLTHVYINPCIIAKQDGKIVYFGVPTIQCEYNVAQDLMGLKWELIHAGESYLTSKFSCLP